MEKNRFIKIIISVYFAVLFVVSTTRLIVDLDNKKNDKLRSVKELSHIITPGLITAIKKKDYLKIKKISEDFFKKEFITKVVIFNSENKEFSESKKRNRDTGNLFFHTSLKSNGNYFGKIEFFSDGHLFYDGFYAALLKILIFFIIHSVLLYLLIRFYLVKKIVNFIDAFWRSKQIVFSVNSDL